MPESEVENVELAIKCECGNHDTISLYETNLQWDINKDNKFNIYCGDDFVHIKCKNCNKEIEISN